MFREIVYSSGTGLERVPLNSNGIYIGKPNDLQAREWGYDLGHRDVSGAVRDSREVSVSVVFMDELRADLLCDVADRDVACGTPGTLWVGEWFQRAYIVGCKPKEIAHSCHSGKMTVVLLDGVWRKGVAVSFEAKSPDGSGEDLNLPYNLPYNLSTPPALTYITVDAWLPAPVRLVVYGPAINPAITIGGNLYQVDATVATGGYLTIDPLSRTVVMVNNDGSTVDCFPDAHRGEGMGSGEYIFQPLPMGTSGVGWDGSFSFDAVWYQERGQYPYGE